MLGGKGVEDCVYGRVGEKEAIIKLLLQDDETSNEINVIPIVGMAGIGKTTFAQLIYNDERVRQQHYDLFAWIYVSEGFDVLRITQIIDQKINSTTCAVRTDDLDQLQSKVKMTLTGKKSFFVLDDVWNDDFLHWDSLRRPFLSGAHGSTIIVTTRSERVASMMGNFQAFHLKPISDNDAWLLFEKHAFGKKGVPAPSNLEEIRKQVVGKCKGHPLTIKALGGLLRSYTSEEEWRSILNSGIWEVKSNIMPSLLLSYRYLPPCLKRCFAYCSMFPRGYEFERAELISLWKAEDLIQSTDKKRVEEVGEEYFNGLVSVSFFQPYQFRATENKVYHKMHDLINDLAKFVSGEFCVSWEDSDSSTVMAKTRHFSYMKRYAQSNEKFEALRGALSLRTFLPLTQKMQIQVYRYQMRHDVLNDLLPTLRCLRVLNLSAYDISWLPDSIHNLIHLRHLNMSSTSIRMLPESICTLYNLQELLLADCKDLTGLPTNLGRLIKLTYLDVKGTHLEKMPAHMGNLKDLMILDKFVLHQDTAEHDLLELKKLQNLSGTLRISKISYIVLDRPPNAHILKDKKFLNKVVLNWAYYKEGEMKDPEGFNWSCDTQIERELLDKLQPHTNLKDLSIDFYRGTAFPDWPNYYSSSSALVYLRLFRCENCISLPPLGQLPSLRELRIVRLNAVKSIGPEFYGNSRETPFRSLQVLIVNRMLGLEEWSNIGDANHEVELFPNLGELRLSGLPKLTGKFAFDNFPMLKILNIDNTQLSLAVLRIPNKVLALTSLRFTACPKIVSFPDGMLHAPNLTELEIRRCQHLGSMPKQMNTLLPSLQQLRISNCEKLESFPEGGLPSELQLLEISCRKLIANHKQWGLHRLTSLKHLLLFRQEYEEHLESFPEEGVHLPNTLTFLSIANFLNLKTINQKGFGDLKSLQTLEIVNCPALQCLPGERLPTSLTSLRIEECPLLKERCERKRGHDWPKIAHVPIIIIDKFRI